MNNVDHSSSDAPQGRPTMTDLLDLQNTAIVLDSTCDAPAGFFDRPGLYMVPLKVHFGDETYRDGVDMTREEFFAKLEASEVLPTTSQPTAAEFLAAYQEARQTYDHVFSLHISGEMSGTVRSAEQAAVEIDGVEVHDLRTVSAALSLCAERLRARLERWLHARRGRRVHQVLQRPLEPAGPRRDPRVPASRRPHRASRFARRRRLRHQAADPHRRRHP